MFHPRKRGCNAHVAVHRNCDIHVEHLTSCAYMFVHVSKCREQVHFSMLPSHTFQQDKWIRGEGKSRVLHLHLIMEDIMEQWDLC